MIHGLAVAARVPASGSWATAQCSNEPESHLLCEECVSCD